MDTEKWKSVLVPKEVYEEIKRTSADRGRTISGQLKIIWQIYNKLKENLILSLDLKKFSYSMG